MLPVFPFPLDPYKTQPYEGWQLILDDLPEAEGSSLVVKDSPPFEDLLLASSEEWLYPSLPVVREEESESVEVAQTTDVLASNRKRKFESVETRIPPVAKKSLKESEVTGIALFEARKKKGLSQKKVANQAGVDVNKVRRAEKNPSSINYRDLKLIVSKLGLEYLGMARSQLEFLERESLFVEGQLNNDRITGADLREARKANRLTQQNLADLAGVDRNMVRRAEKDPSSITSKDWRLIVVALGLETSERL